MVDGLLASLPAPRARPSSPPPLPPAAPQVEVKKKKKVPPYLQRQGFSPRNLEDYGDGGSYPEINTPQFPLGMGSEKGGNSGQGGGQALALAVHGDGSVAYDALVQQKDKTVFSKHSQLVPKLDLLRQDLSRPEKEEEEAVAQRTAAALEKRVQSKLSASQPKSLVPQQAPSEYIKYTPNGRGADGHNSGASTRIVKMVEAPVDPFQPPKFRHKRVPKGPGSPPVPVMHSPPRAVTAEDQKDWKIPPCISNWKNSRGYTIPLDKRLAADGRGLQDVQINDNFAKLSESLYVAEQTARKAVEMRSKVQKELLSRQKEKKEQTLRDLAQQARMERAGALGGEAGMRAPMESEAVGASVGGFGRNAVGSVAAPYESSGRPGRYSDDDNSDRDEVAVDEHRQVSARAETMDTRRDRDNETEKEREDRLRREEIRDERRRERERERRLEAKGEPLNKKSKLTRDRDRDVSERIALGQANVKRSGEAMYDQRLFNQGGGVGSGHGTEDGYNVYDKALFADRGTNLYRPKTAQDGDAYGDDGGMTKILDTAKFKADKGFDGADGKGAGGGGGPRSGPVAFEREAEDDPFGLDQFMSEVKKGKKAMEQVGRRGQMHASGGGDGTSGSGRDKINFREGGR